MRWRTYNPNKYKSKQTEDTKDPTHKYPLTGLRGELPPFLPLQHQLSAAIGKIRQLDDEYTIQRVRYYVRRRP